MMKLSTYLGDRPFWRSTLHLALPIALQNVLTSSFQIVDTMMVSRLGDVTLSAVGMAGQVSWLVGLLNFGLASGLSIFVAQYWGVRDRKGIRKMMGLGLVTCLIFSLLAVALSAAMPERILRLFNQDDAVVGAGCRYLVLACLSYPAVAVTNVLSTVLRGVERPRLPLYVSVLTTIANAVLNYGLIFGKLGLPRLEVEGAALATCISAWLGPVLLLAWSAWEKNILTGALRELIAFTRRDLAEFFRKALPVVFDEGLWALGIVGLNMIFSNMGHEYYAGLTIYKTFGDLAFAFYTGLGGACIVMVGKSIGQGEIRRGLTDAWRFILLTPLAALAIGLVIIAFRHPLVAAFAGESSLSALTVKTALSITVFACLELPVKTLGYILLVGVLRSGGDTVQGMLCDLGSFFLVGLPFTWAAAHWLHLPFVAVVAVAYLSEDFVKALLCLIYFLSKKWIKPVTPEGIAGLEAYNRQKSQ